MVFRKRFKRGQPTPLFDLLEAAPTLEKKLEIIKGQLHGLTDGQRGVVGALLIKCSDQTGGRMGYKDAADLVELRSENTILYAMHVLRAGTPREIADLKNGHRGVQNLARIISKRSPLPVSARRAKGSNSRGKQVDRLRRQQDRAEMWHMLKAAISGLTSLPLPEEVSTEIRKSYMMRQYTDERLDRALKWLKDFTDAYRSQGTQGQEGGETPDQIQDGDDSSDAGTSGRAA